ncbi:hypothetical protein C0J52_07247 [Blattella germanica]|nr:hypothetical protein C0J52_07247 [Blattella germanica]
MGVYTLFFTYDKINKPVIHRWAFILLPMCSMIEYIISIGEHWTFGSWDTLYSFDEDGVAHRIVFFVLEGIILFLLLLMIDYDAVRKLLYGMSKGNIPDLSKRYEPRKYAVNQINFAVERGECFGLLGTNGAGKTTIFKMILGNVSIGEGDIYLHGYSVKNVRRQTLYMYALIRGIPLKHIKNTIYELANTMLFTEHLDKKIENLSGGTKRKVSACVAIMANPPLILLDEPTTGIDPDAKRRMWDLISAVRESGSCIVLSSHSMDECEALCTRLTILIRGNMMCIGSIQHLKNTFSKEYSLMIKGKVQPVPPPVLQPDMPPPPPPDPCRMDLITKFNLI